MKGYVNGGSDRGHGLKVGFFIDESLTRAHREAALGFEIGDGVAPIAGLFVQILPTFECSSGKETVFDIVKITFNDRFSIRMADGVGDKTHGIDAAESLHLGGDGCVGSASVCHDHRGVVDDDNGGYGIEIVQGVCQETLGFEAGETGVVLEEEHAAESEGKGCTLGGDGFFVDDESMGGCVVLCFGPGHIVIGAAGCLFRPSQLSLANQSGEGGVGHLPAVFGGEQLLNQHGIAFAADKELFEERA